MTVKAYVCFLFLPFSVILKQIDCVADPDPEGSETFCRIRSGSKINIAYPDTNPDPKQICKKEPYIQAKIR